MFAELPLTTKEAILQPIQHAEIARQSTNLFSATEVAETIGTDLETINAWLEVGAIDRAVFGGGLSRRSTKPQSQRLAPVRPPYRSDYGEIIGS